MDRVYSDGFILDCANPIKVSDNESLHKIRDQLKSRKLNISILDTGYWIDKIGELKEGNDFDKHTYNQVMRWFDSAMLGKCFFSSAQLPQKVDDQLPSSVWLESVEQEKQLLTFLDENNLLSVLKEELLNNHYVWLFKSKELDTISFKQRFRWSDYLAPYYHYTDKIFIWDRYLLYGDSTEIIDLLTPFFDFNPEAKIEIISEFDSANHRYNIALKNVKALIHEFDNQISCFKMAPEAGKKYHDRFLLTGYAIIKSEPGFNIVDSKNKSVRNTTPTLTGRYADSNHKWKAETNNWDSKKKKYCELIDV